MENSYSAKSSHKMVAILNSFVGSTKCNPKIDIEFAKKLSEKKRKKNPHHTVCWWIDTIKWRDSGDQGWDL